MTIPPSLRRPLAVCTSFSLAALVSLSVTPAMADSSLSDRLRASAQSFLGSERALELGGRAILAVLLFVGGWMVARLVASGIYSLLRRSTLDNKIADKLGLSSILPSGSSKHGVERLLSKIVYWVLMLLVVVGVLDYAGLEQVAAPLQGLVNSVAGALPRIGKAALILGVAYLIARVLSYVVRNAMDGIGVDKRFADISQSDQDKSPPFSATASKIVFWLIIVFGLAGAFQALDIQAIAEPLHNALDRVVSMAPRLAIAALILFAGWVLGKVLRVVASNLLESVGLDKGVDKIGLGSFLGKNRASELVGTLLMVFVVLQATIAGLNELGLNTLSGPLVKMVSQVWDLLPALVISAAIIAAGVFVGGLLRAFVTTGLKNLEFDDRMEKIGFGRLSKSESKVKEYSELVGYGVQVAVVLLTVAQALDNVSLDTWALYVNTLLAYLLQNVVAALAIILVGFAIGGYVRDLVAARQGEQGGQWAGEFARYAVLVFAVTMAVRQLEVAEDFVLLTFGLLFGALCLAGGLAFGLGGREVAQDVLRRRYEDARTGSRDKDSTPTSDA